MTHDAHNWTLCYAYARNEQLLSKTAASSIVRPITVCSVEDDGCPQQLNPAHTLVLVVVLRFETQNIRDWLLYHTHLGVSQFVLISNECDERHHSRLLTAVADLPCAPKLNFIHSYRCARGFQTRAYTDAVRLLLSHGESGNIRVGFLDVDEFLVVHRRDDENGTAVDELFRQGSEKAPMWELSTKPFGPALHLARPKGFLPANFLFGSDLPNNLYGAYPKSMCLLSEMQKALLNNEVLFPHPNAYLNGKWPHHCLPMSKAWSFERTTARLNHYATRHEQEWTSKCNRPNPTFAEKSREGKHYCSKEGMAELFQTMSDHIDLMMFESLDRTNHEMMPLRFLVRTEPASIVEALLQSHCVSHWETLKGGALALCSDSLAHNVSFDSAHRQTQCTQLYRCGTHAPEGGQLRHPSSSRVLPLPPCDCPKLRMDSYKNSERCKKSKDNGSFCFLFCCRPMQLAANANLRKASRPS